MSCISSLSLCSASRSACSCCTAAARSCLSCCSASPSRTALFSCSSTSCTNTHHHLCAAPPRLRAMLLCCPQLFLCHRREFSVDTRRCLSKCCKGSRELERPACCARHTEPSVARYPYVHVNVSCRGPTPNRSRAEHNGIHRCIWRSLQQTPAPPCTDDDECRHCHSRAVPALMLW